MNFYAFHIGDYSAATRHLSWAEDLAYRRLLDVYYVREGALPSDLRQVFRLVVATTDEQREAVEVVLGEFFELTDSGYIHSRCEEEISKAQHKRDKASQSALTRWSNAKNEVSALPTKSERNANASKEICERIAEASKQPYEGNAPNPNPNPNKNQLQREAASPSGFAEFWAAYPKKIGKGAAEKAFKSARINGHMPDLLAAIEAQKQSDQWRKDGGQFIPNPATWLNQRRWEDVLAQPVGSNEIPGYARPNIPGLISV
jgi:uncharacterized protein YdaU (DUF1376 family)